MKPQPEGGYLSLAECIKKRERIGPTPHKKMILILELAQIKAMVSNVLFSDLYRYWKAHFVTFNRASTVVSPYF